jgi:hypothetical protein
VPAAAYHPRVTPPPVLLAALLVVGVLALVPVSRLRTAGWPPLFLGGYWLSLVALGLLVVVARAGFRILLPLLLVGYLAPIIVLRLRRRRSTGSVTRR